MNPAGAITIDGPFLSGVAAALTAAWSILLWVFNRISKLRAKEFIDATTAAVQAVVASRMRDIVEGRDPETYYTMDLAFPDGNKLIVPMIPGVPVRVLENVDVTVLHHAKDETILSLVCDGFGHIGQHCHELTSERIEIKKGQMTDIRTGRIYRAGDVWDIPAGEMHGATFQDVVALLYHKPPLPTAAERPVNLDAMERIYRTKAKPRFAVSSP